MEDRRGEGYGRREEDTRWLKVQEQVMNLVTTQRTSQQVISKVEMEVGRLEDHVEEVDKHLRGVGGHESMDARVAVMEREVTEHGALLRRISSLLDDIKTDVSSIKIYRSLNKESDANQIERTKTWLTFWGPILLAAIALILPLGKFAYDHYERHQKALESDDYRPDEKFKKQIEAEKKSQRAAAVKKKLAAIERQQKALGINP